MKIINFCIKYKYLLTIAVFLLYLFFGDNNIFENRKWNKEIKELDNKLKYCKVAVDNIKTQNNKSSITTKEEEEEYFRNHLYLKKNNEDVFRIVYDKNKK
jgi:cell division protein FtsB